MYFLDTSDINTGLFVLHRWLFDVGERACRADRDRRLTRANKPTCQDRRVDQFPDHNNVRDRRRRAGRDDAGPAAGPRRRGCDRDGKACRLPARFPRRHRACQHPAPARRTRARSTLRRATAPADRLAAAVGAGHSRSRSTCATCPAHTSTSRSCRSGTSWSCSPLPRGRSRRSRCCAAPRCSGRCAGRRTAWCGVTLPRRRRRSTASCRPADGGLRRPRFDTAIGNGLGAEEFRRADGCLVVPRAARREGDPHGLAGVMGAGHAVAMIDRGDYFQCAFVIPKGSRRRAARRGHRGAAPAGGVAGALAGRPDRRGDLLR